MIYILQNLSERKKEMNYKFYLYYPSLIILFLLMFYLMYNYGVVVSFGSLIVLVLLFSLFFKCHKCQLSYSDIPDNGKYLFGGGVTPLVGKYCRQCGQNLLKQEIESDEITNERIEG
jgi:hypothetical protein